MPSRWSALKLGCSMTCSSQCGVFSLAAWTWSNQLIASHVTAPLQKRVCKSVAEGLLTLGGRMQCRSSGVVGPIVVEHRVAYLVSHVPGNQDRLGFVIKNDHEATRLVAEKR